MTQQDNSQDLAHALAAADLAECLNVIHNASEWACGDDDTQRLASVMDMADKALTKHAPTITQGQKLKRLVDAAVAFMEPHWAWCTSNDSIDMSLHTELKEAVADWKGE